MRDMRYYHSYIHGRGRFILIRWCSWNVPSEVEVIMVMGIPLEMLASIGTEELHLR